MWSYPAHSTIVASRMSLKYPNIIIPHIWKYSQKLCTVALLCVKDYRNNELKTWYFVKYQSVWYFFAEHDVFISCSWAGICNYFCYMWYHRFKCRHWQRYYSYVFILFLWRTCHLPTESVSIKFFWYNLKVSCHLNVCSCQQYFI